MNANNVFRNKTKATLLLFVALVSGCAGTGLKGTDQILRAMESDETAVLVMRQTGFTGMGALVEVKVDGLLVGDLGEKEFLSHTISPGDHTVSVKFKGLGGVGMNKVMKTFTVSAGEKAYFQIKLKTGLLTNQLEMIGVTSDSFLYANQ